MASIQVYRVSVPDAVNTIVVPNLKNGGFYKNFVIKNIGALVSCRVNFDGDPNNYITLSPGASTPVMKGLRGGDLVYTDGIAGSTTLEVIVWEDR